MALPPVKLDDMTFQNIVDHAKKLIPDYCPEWTDHNVSDPGVTLIELFASMTEMLLYRVNQVPEKVHRTLLELVGIQLAEPNAAFVEVTFYLTEPASNATPLMPKNTEVATLRTETQAAITFSTEEDIRFHPPELAYIATTAAGKLHPQNAGYFIEDVLVFGEIPKPENALYLGFAHNPGNTVIEIEVLCDTSRTYGLDTAKPPPWGWEVWSTKALQWIPCVQENDDTGGFTWNGRVRLRLPRMSSIKLFEQEAFWMRLVLTDEQHHGPNKYGDSPVLKGVRAHTVGATVPARHATIIEREMLGVSNGTREQVFRLRHWPLLSRDHNEDYLLVFNGQEEQHWKEVDDFGDSRADDRHYTLDGQDGTLRFGPVLPMPSGGVARFGAVPPMGSRLVFRQYRYGGGKEGNVAPEEINVLKTSLSYINRVVNWRAARGGTDSEDIELAKLHAPARLRTHNRAVTRADFEYLTYKASSQIGRAYCIAPGVVIPGADTEDELAQPGQVIVLVLRALEEQKNKQPFDKYIEPSELVLPDYLLQEVQRSIAARAMLGVEVIVRSPALLSIKVDAQIKVASDTSAAQADEIREQAERQVYRYLNPYTGGAQAQGWAPGMPVSVAEIAALLQFIPGVSRVEDVRLFGLDLNVPVVSEVIPSAAQIICSARHYIH